MVFIESPNEMGRINEPADVQYDKVAEGEGNKYCCLHGVVEVFEGSVDGEQNEEDQVKHPIKSARKMNNFLLNFLGILRLTVSGT